MNVKSEIIPVEIDGKATPVRSPKRLLVNSHWNYKELVEYWT